MNENVIKFEEAVTAEDRIIKDKHNIVVCDYHQSDLERNTLLLFAGLSADKEYNVCQLCGKILSSSEANIILSIEDLDDLR